MGVKRTPECGGCTQRGDSAQCLPTCCTWQMEVVATSAAGTSTCCLLLLITSQRLHTGMASGVQLPPRSNDDGIACPWLSWMDRTQCARLPIWDLHGFTSEDAAASSPVLQGGETGIDQPGPGQPICAPGRLQGKVTGVPTVGPTPTSGACEWLSFLITPPMAVRRSLESGLSPGGWKQEERSGRCWGPGPRA